MVLITNPSDALGIWSIWQPAGAPYIPTMIQHGFSNGGGFGHSVLTMADDGNDPERLDYQVEDGVATLELVGPLVKYDASWFGGTSTIYIRDCLAACLTDTRVTSIALVIDSPGGTVSGTKDLADAVAAASQEKPCYAYIQDIGCSAAFWIASQATKCYANETAIVGSIGTFAVVKDFSAAFEAQGVKVHVVKAGEFKGTGEPGTPVTEEQLAERQTLINALNDQFVKQAAKGRKMSLRNMKALADGRAHIAAKAQELGLIDGVMSLGETLSMLSKSKASRRGANATWNEETGLWAEPVAIEPTETPEPVALELPPEQSAEATTPTEIVNMSDTALETAKVAATLAQVKDACPGSDAGFVLAQLEAGATVEAAAKAWTVKLTEMLAAKDAALVEAKSAKAAAKEVGVETLGDKSTGATGSTDPISAFEKLKDDYQAKYKDAGVAMRKLVSENAAAHDAYLAAYAAANPFKRRA